MSVKAFVDLLRAALMLESPWRDFGEHLELQRKSSYKPLAGIM